MEIARKEFFSYFSGKMAVLRNLLMLVIFSYVPISQINGALAASGYSSAVLGLSLETYLLFSSFYAIMMGSTIAVMAFPYEKEMKTIEYLFSLPLKDFEIFAGKALAAIVAGLGGLVFVMAVISGYILLADGPMIQWTTPFPTASLMLTVLVIAPLLVLLSVLIIVAVSSFLASMRMTYLPTYVIMGVFIGLSFAKYQTDIDTLLIDGVIIGLLAVSILLALAISLKTFNRERIAGS
jgi:ABC-type transport system involved in multi-copper enzyme maturation permease subunit